MSFESIMLEFIDLLVAFLVDFLIGLIFPMTGVG